LQWLQTNIQKYAPLYVGWKAFTTQWC
jgi:hypothetical protein